MFCQTRYLGICAGCALVCATAAAGQSAGDAAGSIDGTVRDASGARAATRDILWGWDYDINLIMARN